MNNQFLFQHLRNICEICEEISHSSDAWAELFTHLKVRKKWGNWPYGLKEIVTLRTMLITFNEFQECYADIVCETDFMEPISHVSMKKNPLLSVRDLVRELFWVKFRINPGDLYYSGLNHIRNSMMFPEWNLFCLQEKRVVSTSCQVHTYICDLDLRQATYLFSSQNVKLMTMCMSELFVWLEILFAKHFHCAWIIRRQRVLLHKNEQ